MQRPRPPLLLGGGVDAALRRAGRIADGWISSSGQDLTAIGTAAAVVRGRRPRRRPGPRRRADRLRGVVRVRAGRRTRPAPADRLLDEVRADLAVLAEQGVTEVFLDLNFDPEVGLGRTPTRTSRYAGGSRCWRRWRRERRGRRRLAARPGGPAPGPGQRPRAGRLLPGQQPSARRPRRGVAGLARNLPDGRVEVVLEGPPDEVAAVLAWLRQGPAHARVETVEVTEEPVEGLRGFEIA